MMLYKKYFLLSVLITSLFISNFLLPIKSVQAQNFNISQFVELLISIGAIAPEKAVAARAVATTLSSATTTPTISTAVSTSTSYIQVFTPNGGESWEIDLDIARSITWGSSGLSQVRVALVSSVKKNPVCELTPNLISTRNGNNEFKVLLKTAQCYNLATGTSTPLTDGTYKARVYFTDSYGTTISDESNAVFKILPKPIPSFKVVYPNGGEQLIRNREYNVTYKFTNVTNVVDNLIYLYLLDNNGNTVFNSRKIKRSDNTYSLDLPGSLSAGAYKIKLKTTTNDRNERIELEDVSDNFFWINLP